MKNEFIGRVKNRITGRSLNTRILNNTYNIVQKRITSLPFNKKTPSKQNLWR
jgi:hypothetical protein